MLVHPRRVSGFEMEWATGDIPEFPQELATTPHLLTGRPLKRKHLPSGIIEENTMLTNGARLYHDEHHIEYSGPEIRESDESGYSWLDEIVASEIVGEEVVRLLLTHALQDRAISKFALHKRVVDIWGTTWGYHENYLCDRKAIPTLSTSKYGTEQAHPDIDLLTTWLAVRNLLTGAGGMVRGQYVLGQKSSQLTCEATTDTVSRKPLVNLRDEAHANATDYRRLHFTAADANISPFVTRLKFGATALFLRMTEAGKRAESELRLKPGYGHELAKRVSTDTTFEHRVVLNSGETVPHIELIARLAGRAATFIAGREDVSPEERWVVATLHELVDGFREDPWQLDSLDWVMRKHIIDRQLGRLGLSIDTTAGRDMAEGVDLRYDFIADPDSKANIAARLRDGKWKEWMPPKELVERRMTEAPPGRPEWRGRAIRDGYVDATWTNVKDAKGIWRICRNPLAALDSSEFNLAA